MRSSVLVAVAAATAPFAVSAKGTLGYALGSRHADGTCKNYADFDADFKFLASTNTSPNPGPGRLDSKAEQSPIVRTYAQYDGGVDGVYCNITGVVLPAAEANGFKVVIGLWAESLQNEIDEFHKYAEKYSSTVYAVTVGSESLYRFYNQPSNPPTGLSNVDLNDRINEYHEQMEAAGLNFPIGTADSWNKYQDGTANNIIQNSNVSILLVNAFGYWQAQNICNASATYLDDLQQAFAIIQSTRAEAKLSAVELWNGETGWPSSPADNPPYGGLGGAVTGINEAYTYWKHGVCAALGWNWNVFYFEAFDEPWKPAATGADGSKQAETGWGAFGVDRTLKFPNGDYSCRFATNLTNDKIVC